MKKHFCFQLLAAMSAFAMTSCEIPLPISHVFEFSGEHCTIRDKNEYKVNVADLGMVELEIVADNGYALPSEITEPEGLTYKASEDSLTAKITIPIMRKDCALSIQAEFCQINITFKDINRKDIKLVACNRGTTWEKIEKEKPDDPTLEGYYFRGWSLEPTGAGEIIKNDRIFNTDTTIYPSFNYNCEIVNPESSLEIYTTSGGYSKDLIVTLAIKADKFDDYDLPTKDNCRECLKVTAGIDARPVEDWTYELNDGGKTANLTIPYGQIPDGDVKINVTNYQPEYDIRTIEYGYLFFTEYRSSEELTTKPKRGSEYKFTVRANNSGPENDAYYYVSFPDIYINGSPVPLEEKYCDVEFDTEHGDCPQYANITIHERIIKGDVVLSGRAKQKGYYQYQLTGFGINNVEIGYCPEGEATTIPVVPTKTEYKVPTADNIGVWVNDEELVRLSQLITDTDGKISYNFNPDKTTGTITISKDISITDYDSFEFYPVAEGFNLLNALSWSDISMIATSEKYDPEIFFHVGQEKNIKVKLLDGAESTYTARIIDFKHDSLAEDPTKKVGITFEFTNLLSINYSWYRAQYTLAWASKSSQGNCKFVDSELNTRLNNEVFNALENEIKAPGIIKQVEKWVGGSENEGANYEPTSYKTKLFPFAAKEIIKDPKDPQHIKDGDEEQVSLYKYYENHSPIKQPKDMGYNCKYWLRSPYCETSHDKSFSYLEELDKTGVSEGLGVSVAFCI